MPRAWSSRARSERSSECNPELAQPPRTARIARRAKTAARALGRRGARAEEAARTIARSLGRPRRPAAEGELLEGEVEEDDERDHRQRRHGDGEHRGEGRA